MNQGSFVLKHRLQLFRPTIGADFVWLASSRLASVPRVALRRAGLYEKMEEKTEISLDAEGYQRQHRREECRDKKEGEEGN